MKIRIAASLLAGVLFAEPVIAGTPFEVEKICPVGGERFTHIETASYSTFGARPDGKPYGSWEFPLPLAECPGNGLVLFDDFKPEVVATLAPLLETREYQALRKTDASYYRAYWLAQRLGFDPERTLLLLMQAGWQPQPGTPLRNRYLTELVDAVKQMPDTARPGLLDAARKRAANALRELGRFEEASAMLAALPSEPRVVEGAPHYADMLRVAVARRDGSAEPLDMIPVQFAYRSCLEREGQLSAFETEFCARPDARKAVGEMRARDAARKTKP